MISYGSAITSTPMRCRRFVDDSTPGSSARVCGAPIPATGAGRAGSYCPACVARLTLPVRSRPRVPSGPVNDPWLLPPPDEIAELLG